MLFKISSSLTLEMSCKNVKCLHIMYKLELCLKNVSLTCILAVESYFAGACFKLQPCRHFFHKQNYGLYFKMESFRQKEARNLGISSVFCWERSSIAWYSLHIYLFAVSVIISARFCISPVILLVFPL